MQLSPSPTNHVATKVPYLRALLTGCVLFTLVACASAPQPPLADLQAAELAITNAEQARVADYAAPDMDQAFKKLTAARAAVQEEDMVLAQRLAVESRASADLASAKTEMLKAKAVNDEMQNSIDALTLETQRNAGAPQ